MTYTQARLVIWNPMNYPRAKVRKACIVILGTLGARAEDISRATWLV